MLGHRPCLPAEKSSKAECPAPPRSIPAVLLHQPDLVPYSQQHLQNLSLKRIQVDEIWSFVYAKQNNLHKIKSSPPYAGDLWTWIAMCTDTKLVPTWRLGDRSARTAIEFLVDLESRLANRVQLTSDGYDAYFKAVRRAFRGDVDYAALSKIYTKEKVGIWKQIMSGSPDEQHISTSLIERQNLTLRMSKRRYTRKTNAFSKKLENHALDLALHFLHYNFVRIHETLRITPAMASDVADRLYDLEWLVDRVNERWPKPNRPKTYKKNAN